jgi:hypothetical protein
LRIPRPAQTLLALLLSLVPLAVGAQVVIVRQLPSTGENKVQAQWGAAVPTATDPAAEAIRPGAAQFGGHVAVGATGGMNELGAQTFDSFVDTALSLLLPLGGASRVLFSAQAERKPKLDGLDQTYKAGTTLSFDAWQADLGGSFHQLDRGDSTSSSHDMTGDAHASVTLGIIPTLPIAASYSYQRLAQSQADTIGQSSAPKDEGAHHAQLTARGTLGTVGLDSGATFSDITDFGTGVESTGFGGNLALTVPVESFLKVYGSVAPKYTATSYALTGNGMSSTSLESKLGIIIPLSAPLSFKVGAGMVNMWSTQSGPSADPAAPPYQLTWNGTAGVELKQETGMSAETSYTLGKTVSGPLNHSLEASLGYRGPKDALLKDIGTGGSWAVSVDDTGAAVSSHAGWKASVNLGQTDSAVLTASYNGSVDGLSQLAWSNAADASFGQQVTPELGYSLAANLNTAAAAAATPTFDQQYQGKLTFSPRIGQRTYTFALDETLGLSVLDDPAQVISRAGASIAAPVFSILSARYRVDWEWDAQTTPGAGPDSSFHHVFGLTLSGQPLPFSLSAEYGLTHGFRGLRHDVTASLSVSAFKNLSVLGSLSLSEYQSGGAPAVPFLAMLTASYQF